MNSIRHLWNRRSVNHRRPTLRLIPLVRVLLTLLTCGALVGTPDTAFGQNAANPRAGREAPPETPTLGLEHGLIDLTTPDFDLRLVRASQTVATLRPKGLAEPFDFTPADLLSQRAANGYHHLGDLHLRLRVGEGGDWRDFSTASRREPVPTLSVNSPVLAAADISAALGENCPLQVTREWVLDDQRLGLRFVLKNASQERVEIGALGIPMVFNNILSRRTLEQAHALCSFSDPYVGLDAGYVQVTRLNGQGPALLVVPEKGTSFEAYAPILDERDRQTGEIQRFNDPTPRGITFEGFHSWLAHSRAPGEREWAKAAPWNPPTAALLAPGETRTYGVRFLLADQIRHLERTLTEASRPVAIGLPGYLLPRDTEGRLYLKHTAAVRSLEVEPPGALRLQPIPDTPHGWKAYTLHVRGWGRARLLVTYEDGLRQAVHYYLTDPQSEVVAHLGRFLTTRQWFVDPNDPFGRSPSAMTYDREENRIVTQDPRVWVAGLGDEGGSGAWLAAILKQLAQPDREELAKCEQFVDEVLWGGLQYKEGPRQYGVRKSLFYYQPDQFPNYYHTNLDWRSWTSWKKADTERVDRSFNYPHVAALHWTLYRLARNCEGLVTHHSWQWYLTNACQTSLAMTRFARAHSPFGQMEGTVFREILLDLRREGWSESAAELEERMRTRAERWRRQAFPFGSEMPWDSTGQEEVYAWTKHFGDTAKAQVTLNAILGYMPTLPHWGYNGSARRYWDFLYGGKIGRVERQLHHYGSGLNALPMLSEYRDHPDDFYLLRVGHAGSLGALACVDQEGFASAAFHAFPDTLRFDPLSGDYGPNFFGHVMNAATYMVDHPEFGWQGFGGLVTPTAEGVWVAPRDSCRTRLYLAPVGLWLTLDAGQFESVNFVPATGAVRVELAPATPYARSARLRVEQPARIAGVGTYRPIQEYPLQRGALLVPLQPDHGAAIDLRAD